MPKGVEMGREFELKYRATPEQLSAIREKFGPFTEIAMNTASSAPGIGRCGGGWKTGLRCVR